MQRRDFLKLSTAVGIAGALPRVGTGACRRAPSPAYSCVAGGGRQRPVPAQGPAGPDAVATPADPQLGLQRQPARSHIAPARQAVRVRVANQLAETTTIHWHGLEVPGTADGGPQASIPSGKEWQAAFRIEQPAATCWYHPHTHGQTGHQVAMGLAGLFILDDEESLRLPLPQRWGWTTSRWCCRTSGSMGGIRWTTSWT